MKNEIKVNKDFSVPHNQMKKVTALKIYRQGSDFTEYTTGKETYSQHMAGTGAEKPGEYKIFRVSPSQFLKGGKINRVV